jgi:hypothetical protein
MFFPKVCAVLSLALSAAAVSTPHMARNMAVHHAIVARAPAAEAEAAPAIVPVAHHLAKRGNTRRCKPNNGTLPSSSLSSSSVVLPTSTPSKAPAPPVVNPEPAPPSFSSSSVAARPTHSSHSVAEPPATTSSAAPPPPPKTSHTPPPPKATPPPPKATPTPPPTQGSGSSASGSTDPLFTDTHSGDATFYATGLGSCGITNHDTDFIAAVSHLLYDSFPGYEGGNPNNNPICGRKVTAHYGGNEVTVTITDRCTGCAKFDLDFSPAAFDRLASEDLGRLHDMTWTFD